MVGTDASDRRGHWPFTDCVLIGTGGRGTGAYASPKVLSTKGDPVDGVMVGLEKLAANVGLSVGQLLARTSRFGHGTTIGTNAVLERSGPGSGSSSSVVAGPCNDRNRTDRDHRPGMIPPAMNPRVVHSLSDCGTVALPLNWR
jgi:N-methylhydantoinase A/oxoprolinase/acetone carboxylase beta subunit